MLDAVIVGAGAAGIAAGRRLVDAGRSVMLLEARDRIGGRAWTVDLPGIGPMDFGCHWFHSAGRNPLVPLARRLGFTVEEHDGRWGEAWNRAALGARFAAWQDYAEAFWDAAEACARDGRDVACADLAPDGEWRPWLDGIMTFATGAGLVEVSALDLGRALETNVNWRCADGYGAVMARAARGLPVTTGAPVEAVRLVPGGVEVEGPRGTLAARTAILAVPTPLYETIAFAPGLPDEKRAAVADLPLGADDKVHLAVEGTPFGPPEDRQVSPHHDRSATGSYHLHPFGRPVVEGFYGGETARTLEREGIAGFAAFAVEELSAVFGHGVARHLKPVSATGWARDPWSRGAYSYARPGRADARAALAAPVEDRLFFAGEACSIRNPASCHGAWETGIVAAEAVLARPR
jgi:monoamine oxidase